MECDETLADFSTVLGQNVDVDYDVFKHKLEEAVANTLMRTKPTKLSLKARLKADATVVDLRVQKRDLFRDMKAEPCIEKRRPLKEELKRVNRIGKQN